MFLVAAHPAAAEPDDSRIVGVRKDEQAPPKSSMTTSSRGNWSNRQRAVDPKFCALGP